MFAEFLSVAISLAEHGGQIIRKVHESGDLSVKDKGVDDPVTIADVKV